MAACVSAPAAGSAGWPAEWTSFIKVNAGKFNAASAHSRLSKAVERIDTAFAAGIHLLGAGRGPGAGGAKLLAGDGSRRNLTCISTIGRWRRLRWRRCWRSSGPLTPVGSGRGWSTSRRRANPPPPPMGTTASSAATWPRRWPTRAGEVGFASDKRYPSWGCVLDKRRRAR